MSELKFSCPSCGQHVQCDISHAGENIPCPSCAQLIRVPHQGDVVKVKPTANENPFAVDEEKVSYTSTQEPGKEKVPTLGEDLEQHSDEPGESKVPVTEREQQLAAARAHTTEPVTHVKPRLSFILSGGQAPAPEENESALTEEQKKRATPDKLKSQIKSLNE
jgi:ribosomal protein S27E